MDAATFGAAMSGLKFAKDSLTALVETKVAINSQAKILEVLSKLGEAQDALFNLRIEMSDLQEQNADLRLKLEIQTKWTERLG